jgi:hypothetical protein
MSARHYEEAGAIEVGRRLEALVDRVSESLAAQDLGPIIGHAREIARERFNSGYDLVEVQAAFNALEAAVWTRVFTVLEPGQFAQTLGFVSTILGAAKRCTCARIRLPRNRCPRPLPRLTRIVRRHGGCLHRS